MKLLLVDESKARAFILCAVELNKENVARVRPLVNGVRKRGQSQVHFVSESDSRKRQILQVYSKLALICTTYTVRGMSETEARQLCIGALIDNLELAQSYEIIFDLDVNHLDADRRTIRQRLESRGMRHQVEYRHEEPKIEKLLWLPDALAWTTAKGGVWKSHLAKFAHTNIRLD